MIIVRHDNTRPAQCLCTQQFENGIRTNDRHIAALLVEPPGVALIRNTITYKNQPRST
jgi:hypothetical protein